MSPAGYSCDFQKEFTPERALPALIVGDVVSMFWYPAIGYTIGFMTGGASVAAQMAASWALIPNFPWDVIFSSLLVGAASRSIFPSCMAFPLVCDLNPTDGTCEMRASSDTMRASSNPFARLPMDGFKCVKPDGDESEHAACMLQTCTGEDVKEHGPGQLFGRTGKIG